MSLRHDTATVHPWLNVACPKCGAAAGDWCKGKGGGRISKPHAGRRDAQTMKGLTSGLTFILDPASAAKLDARKPYGTEVELTGTVLKNQAELMQAVHAKRPIQPRRTLPGLGKGELCLIASNRPSPKLNAFIAGILLEVAQSFGYQPNAPRYVDRPTLPHPFIPSRVVGECAGCIYPETHQIHNL